MPVLIPFGKGPLWASRGDLVYTGTGEAPEIRVHDRLKGLVRIIRWNADAQPVTAADKALYESTRGQLEGKFGTETAADFAALNEFDVPSYKPHFSRIFADDDGYLWVRKYPRNWEGFERIFGTEFNIGDSEWWLFAPDGQLLGLRTTPARFTLHAIRNDTAVVSDHGNAEVFVSPVRRGVQSPATVNK